MSNITAPSKSTHPTSTNSAMSKEIPPLCDYVDSSGKVIMSEAQINHGEELFHLCGLMSYGSFLGGGSERGRDYTADALHHKIL